MNDRRKRPPVGSRTPTSRPRKVAGSPTRRELAPTRGEEEDESPSGRELAPTRGEGEDESPSGRELAPTRGEEEDESPSGRELAPTRGAEEDESPSRRELAPTRGAEEDETPSRRELAPTRGVDLTKPASTEETDSTAEPEDPEEPGSTEDPDSSQAPGRLRTVLLAVVALLLVVGAVEVWYLAFTGDDAAAGQVTEERPVQVSDLTARSVVDQAAAAATTILSSSYETYDDDIDAATALMTDDFAAKYRETKEQIREEFVAAQTEVTIDISAQGVVTADADRLEALLFLTQTTSKNKSTVTPVQYRVTVTMVNTGSGWLVSDLQAR